MDSRRTSGETSQEPKSMYYPFLYSNDILATELVNEDVTLVITELGQLLGAADTAAETK